MPPSLASRYEVRIVDGADGEQRVGLFRPTDRDGPSIEITDDRIVARSEDAETVAALVKIAQHSGWERIAVDGSPVFRKAIWEAATREGLTVRGYEPSFGEQERVEQARRPATERQQEAADLVHAEPAPGMDGPELPASPGAMASSQRDEEVQALRDDGRGLSDGDNRLLLRISALSDDRYRLDETSEANMPPIAREVHVERIEENQKALTSTLDQALESPTLVTAFERSGYTPEALRTLGAGGAWDGDVADAIYLVRSGLHRDSLRAQADDKVAIASEPETDRAQPTSAHQIDAARSRPAEQEPVRQTAGDQDLMKRRRESEDLADAFLRGTRDRVASDPRLAGAREAQVAMELHIGEVFGGDANRIASANLESRQMISDVLRRGLDISVRETTPVRQIEPVQPRPDLER
nr:LPD7 domain-containing protein [Sphingomonas sp. GM_Shp_2]